MMMGRTLRPDKSPPSSKPPSMHAMMAMGDPRRDNPDDVNDACYDDDDGANPKVSRQLSLSCMR